jgi:hypothetical protein
VPHRVARRVANAMQNLTDGAGNNDARSENSRLIGHLVGGRDM